MTRIRSSKTARIATAAIIAFTLTLASPAFAAGPFTGFGDSLTAWARTWLAPFLGVEPGPADSQEGTPVSRSSRSTGDDVPVPTTTGGDDPPPCEPVCTEAGPGGDPNG